jgi:hypothetical protein
MGFSSLIDTLGSIIIGGLLLLTLIRLNANAIENYFVYGNDRIVQRNLVDAAMILENELRKIGYCANINDTTDASKYVLIADSNKVKFLADLDRNGTFDTVMYYVGPKSEEAGTPNPNDRVLYRQLNSSSAAPVSYGVTQFSLIYFNALDDTMSFPTNPAAVKSMQVSLRIEDEAAYNNNYSSAYWRLLRMSSRNLKKR